MAMLKNASNGGIASLFWRGCRGWVCLIMAVLLVAPTHSTEAAGETDSEKSPRLLYNEGTQKLRDGKLQDAEVALQQAVTSQNEKVQPSALYNLGEVRYRQGAEEIKKGPNHQAVRANSQSASERGNDAIKAVDEALAGDDVQTMVSAYLRGRGSRKQLKAATEAVKRAMETYGGVLAKWQRASGDFKSTSELSPSDADAKSNADLVDRSIARLVDQRQMMAQMMDGMKKQSGDLGRKMAELKKRLPQDEGGKLSGKGNEDDDEDGDKPPKEPKPGDQEPENKSGHEIQLTPDEAAHLLDMLKLDAGRKLPLGANEQGNPKNRNVRDW